MWPLGLTLAMTLTLNFQGQTWNLLYLNPKWSDCHEMQSKHIDWTQGLKCDHWVWPWPWPWPWIFKVKHGICYISAKNVLIATKRKAKILMDSRPQMWPWVRPWPWPWPWIFKVKYGICYISAKNGQIAMKRKANIHWTQGLKCDHWVWPWPWPWPWISKVKYGICYISSKSGPKVRCKDLPDPDRGDFRCRRAVDASSLYMIDICLETLTIFLAIWDGGESTSHLSPQQFILLCVHLNYRTKECFFLSFLLHYLQNFIMIVCALWLPSKCNGCVCIMIWNILILVSKCGSSIGICIKKTVAICNYSYISKVEIVISWFWCDDKSVIVISTYIIYIQAGNKGNIKALHYSPFVRGIHQWIPLTKGQ